MEAGVFAAMGELGWDPDVVGRMELWLIGVYLKRPVIRGARQLSVPDENEGPRQDPRDDPDGWGMDVSALPTTS